MPPNLPRKSRTILEDAVRTELRGTVARLTEKVMARPGASAKVGFRLLRGEAHVEIIVNGRLAGADLTVLGRHGTRKLRDMFIGSTAERVIRNGDTPALVVAQKAGRAYARPIVAVDMSDSSRAVVALAARILQEDPGNAALLHVYKVPFEGFLVRGVRGSDMRDMRHELKAEARGAISMLAESVEDFGIDWKVTLRQGDPRTAILRAAEALRSDLIVLGTQGRTGLTHVLLGGVSEWVIRNATRDVLVARPSRTVFRLP
jgi:nucleotide-binding universal stress UspA family protein